MDAAAGDGAEGAGWETGDEVEIRAATEEEGMGVLRMNGRDEGVASGGRVVFNVRMDRKRGNRRAVQAILLKRI